jgi:hypothetical protein
MRWCSGAARRLDRGRCGRCDRCLSAEAAASLLALAAAKAEEERQIVASIWHLRGPYVWQPAWLHGALRAAGLVDDSRESVQS